MDHKLEDFVKGRGSRLENETVIIYNDESDEATITTSSPSTFRRLVRRGHAPIAGFGGSGKSCARFVLQKRRITIRGAHSSKGAGRGGMRPVKQPGSGSPPQLAAARAARKANALAARSAAGAAHEKGQV